MTRSRAVRACLFATPGAALAVVGTTHPHTLSYSSSAHWTIMHVIGLLVFPLVGAALTGLVWRRTDPLAPVVGVAAYVYATAYTALDVIAGIGGRLRDLPVRSRCAASRRGGLSLRHRQRARGGRSLGAAGRRTCARRRSRPAPSAACSDARAGSRRREGVSFLDSHIYPWRGVITVLLIGVATGWLAALSQPGGGSQNSRVEGSSIPRRAL